MFALFQNQAQDEQQQPPQQEGELLPLETQWYDDQYEDIEYAPEYVPESDPEPDPGYVPEYVEPLEQTDEFGESAYEYVYSPYDNQQQEEYYPEQYQESNRENVDDDDGENAEPSDEEIEKNLIHREPWSEKEIPMSAVSGFKKPEPVVEKESDKKKESSDAQSTDDESNGDTKASKDDKDGSKIGKKESNEKKGKDEGDDSSKKDKGPEDNDIAVFEKIWNVELEDLKQNEVPKHNKYIKYWTRVFEKVDKPKGEESDMSTAQQKNEMRNLFTESVKPGNFNEERDVQKIKNLTDNVWIRCWWKKLNKEVSGGSNDMFGRYLAQCSLLCATIFMSMV